MTNPIFPLDGKKIWVAGHRGMVGSAVVRRLARENCEIVTVSRQELDLLRQAQVESWLNIELPDVIILAAAKVGGIKANATYPAEFLYENLMIESNVIHAAFMSKVSKLVYLGSTCVYPKFSPQPIREEYLLTGALEPTNEWYALAKIAGIRLCQAYRRQYGCDYIAAQPTNLYGPGDNYDLDNCHVLPALLRKAHEARRDGTKTMTIWGSGSPLREFLHVDDLADAVIFLTKHYSGDSHINVGSGQEVSIRDLAEIICEVVGFEGELAFDLSNPDGTPRKLADISRLKALGWDSSISLTQGIRDTYLRAFKGTDR